MDTPRTSPARTDHPDTPAADAPRPESTDAPRVVAAEHGEPIERVVSVETAEPTPPVIRTVVNEPVVNEPAVTQPAADTTPRPAAEQPDRLVWWVGAGTVALGTLAAGTNALVRRVRRPRPTLAERIARPEVAAPALALAAGGAAFSAARSARRDDRNLAFAGTAVAPLVADEVDEDDDADVLAAPLETVPLPLEALVLLDTLLDPALAEGRTLPGAAALRAQLPHVRTVPEAMPVEEDAPIPQWLPLVVDPEADVERAVPHEFTWPVRGGFRVDENDFELTLRVIDGEIGALTVLPAEETDEDAWDALTELDAWPGVGQLSFRVDGERRS